MWCLRHSLPDRRDSSRERIACFALHPLLRLCEELPPDGPFVRYPVCKNPHRLLCTAQAAACTVVNCKLLIVSQWQLMKCEGPVQYRPLLLRKAEYQQADSFPFPGNNKMWIT